MARGRKPIPEPEPEVIDIAAEARAEQALTSMRELAVDDANAKQQALFDLGRAVGVAAAMRAMRTFAAAAEIHAFEKINKSRAFKDFSFSFPDGFRPAKNIDEFCRLHFGRGYKSMQDHKRLLQVLGEDAYESIRALELPRAQLRLLMNFPEDERAAVEEAMRDGTKDEVVTLIQSLANKLDEARAQAEDLKADLRATQEVSAEKSAQIDRLKEERVRVKALPPDEVQAELRREVTSHVNTALGMLNGLVAQGFGALCDHDALHGQDSLEILAGHVAQLQRAIYALRDDFNLSDYVGDGTPEWMRATADDADLSPEA